MLNFAVSVRQNDFHIHPPPSSVIFALPQTFLEKEVGPNQSIWQFGTVSVCDAVKLHYFIILHLR